MSDVGGYFDREAAGYFSGDQGNRASHVRSAGKIHAWAEDFEKVLSVGGLWARADLPTVLRGSYSLTVVDISIAMLRRWQSAGIRAFVSDARTLALPDHSMDMVVFPLVLHHITDGSAVEARRNVARAIEEAHRILRPGGLLVISDFTVPGWIYSLELRLAALTRRILQWIGTPLVIMHPQDFYEEITWGCGFESVKIWNGGASSESPWDLVQPVIGVPVRVPRWSYPIRPFLLTARAPR